MRTPLQPRVPHPTRRHPYLGEKVVNFFVVKFEERARHGDIPGVLQFGQPGKHVSDDAGNDADVVARLVTSVVHRKRVSGSHRERLSAARLPVREDGGVISIENLFNEWFHGLCIGRCV